MTGRRRWLKDLSLIRLVWKLAGACIARETWLGAGLMGSWSSLGLDQQVKIRGFRIELGEVETALTAHPSVAQAAVVARQDHAGGKQLVGYVTPAPGATIDVAELRLSLGERLPAYMVPAAFVCLEAFPLTPNGKLDRKALPEPARRQEGYRAPRTPEEEILCRLFAEILSLERVGISDNFFESGGHSLMATRLVSRIRATLDVELPIRALFEAPTVAELTPRLRQARQGRPALTRRERPERLPFLTPSSGCGSSIKWVRADPPTTSPGRCGCEAP